MAKTKVAAYMKKLLLGNLRKKIEVGLVHERRDHD